MCKIAIAALATLLLMGCATTDTNPNDEEIVEDKCESTKATLVMKPWLEAKDKRLMFLLEVEETPQMVRAVAVNNEEKRILVWVKNYLDRAWDEGRDKQETDPYKVIGMCGKWIEGDWNEFPPGNIDFEIVQLAVYDVWSKRYIEVRTNFGDRWTDALKGVNWKKLLFDLGKKALP
jgi:hypothetical protein